MALGRVGAMGAGGMRGDLALAPGWGTGLNGKVRPPPGQAQGPRTSHPLPLPLPAVPDAT
ncbi:MAG TPA: hypothetical protein VFA10_11020 [Ktedonobacteraceae bacterium]|nr:hypothetical protein [Ktedonobacteraceae bacterium]